MGDMVVPLVPEFKYVGIWFTSVHANIFARHYAIKASKSRSVANAIFALKHRIGSLPVREGLLLYKAQMDCHLTSGCELSLDTGALVSEHVESQHLLLRRLLGSNPRSMIAILFTETGIMPVRMRRLLLALGRLEYMLSTDPGRVVHFALLDSIALFREGKPQIQRSCSCAFQRRFGSGQMIFSAPTQLVSSRRRSSALLTLTCSAILTTWSRLTCYAIGWSSVTILSSWSPGASATI
ncbi:hypothetical protein B0H13DRAFT_2150896 [Mycena leptocephala]|nr:hypothetical protein B0H13DRAFT_2150896 [Mycena leptocephala]